VTDRAPGLLRFGVFELDLETRELRRRGRLVALAGQPFTVLALLASRPGVLVTREELRRTLWGEDVHVEHERSLNFCVNRIRRALDDSARSPRFLETVKQQGYRFLAPTDAPQVHAAHRPRAALGLAVLALSLQAAALPRHSAAGGPGLPSGDPRAQAEFERGRRLLDEGPAGWRESVAHFKEAARRDRGFALAHYGLADAYMRLGENGVLGAPQAFPAARAAVKEALAIEDRAEPLVIQAALELDYDWNWDAAERSYRRALLLDRNLGAAQAGYARLLSAAGRHDEARTLVEDLEAREPGSPERLRDAAFVHYRAHDISEARRRFGHWAALQPEEKDPHHWLALLAELDGRPTEAKAEALRVLQLSGLGPSALVRFGALAPSAAMEEYWRGSLRFLEALSGSRRVGAEERARLEALLGEAEKAIASLEQAADDRSPGLVAALAWAPRGSRRAAPCVSRASRCSVSRHKRPSIAP
jgi:DNA-binding winged helix-turn-helix (wHTH) protein/Tfp pilus assembly protein PilF